MKRLLIVLLTLALIGSGIYIYLIQNGHNLDSILNTPDKINLRVECSEVENLLLTSTVNIRVKNLSSRTHENVVIRITAYDKNGDIVKQKETTFLRTLEANESMTKPVTLPAKTSTCDCVVLDSDPK